MEIEVLCCPSNKCCTKMCLEGMQFKTVAFVEIVVVKEVNLVKRMNDCERLQTQSARGEEMSSKSTKDRAKL
jgi:hypothetical protein